MNRRMCKRGLTNKRLLIVFSILIFFVVIIILGSTMFNLHTVEVKFLEEFRFALDHESIAESCNVYKGKNLLFLSKKKVAATIQGNNVYAKNITLVKKFPNTLEVHLAERQELFTIRLKDSTGAELYYMYDADGVALRSDPYNKYNALPGVNKENIKVTGITDDDVLSNVFGKSINLHNPAKINGVKNVLSALLGFYTELRLRDFISEINVTDMREIVLTTATQGNSSMKIKLNERIEDMDRQIAFVVGIFENLSDEQKRNSYVKVVYNNNTKDYEPVWGREER